MTGLLQVNGVSKRFGAFPVLHAVNLKVNKGEFISLLGPSGCGKSTLLRLIAGLEELDEGDILIDGRSMAGVRPFRRPLTMMFQSHALFPHMKVGENVAFGLRARGVRKEIWREKVVSALRLVGLEGTETRQVQELSGGQRQRVALARCLVVEPSLLLLDEPLSALDLQLRRQLQFELKDIQRRSGCSFIFVTHDQEEAMSMSDMIAVMNRGVIEQFGTPDEVYHRPRTAFAARFIGEANILPAELFGAVNAVEVKTGYVVAVRPERFTILPETSAVPSPEFFQMRGTLRSVVQIGPLLRHFVDTPSGSVEAAVLSDPAGNRLTLGSEVTLRCAVSDIHIVKGERQ